MLFEKLGSDANSYVNISQNAQNVPVESSYENLKIGIIL